MWKRGGEGRKNGFSQGIILPFSFPFLFQTQQQQKHEQTKKKKYHPTHKAKPDARVWLEKARGERGGEGS